MRTTHLALVRVGITIALIVLVCCVPAAIGQSGSLRELLEEKEAEVSGRGCLGGMVYIWPLLRIGAVG